MKTVSLPVLEHQSHQVYHENLFAVVIFFLSLFHLSAAEEIELGSESDDEEESSTLSNLSPEEIRQREKAQKDKGTAGKETEAGAEISALVNYVQPVHFHSFEHAESNGHSHFGNVNATRLISAFFVGFFFSF